MDMVTLMANQIERGNLISLLSHSADFSLTILVAAAGSGKTTLLDQWQISNANLNIARVDIRDSDQNLNHFLKKILSAIKQTVEVFDASIFNLFKNEDSWKDSHIVESFIQVLESIDETLFLVIDDYQYTESESSSALLNAVVKRLPANIHIILSSRRYPALDLIRFKIEDKLLQIDAYDLVFDPIQVMELNERLGGDSLNKERLSAIMESTEGWVAGVKIALLACRKYGANALEVFNGDQPDLVNYFGSEVYQELSENIKTFLLCTSIFERFNRDLCDAVLSRRDSNSIISELLDQALFIMPLSDKPGWYRYHSLLSDFLRMKLSSAWSEAEIEKLHGKAGQYLMDHGDYKLGLSHLYKSNNNSAIDYGITHACEHWLKQGDFSNVIATLDNLGEDQVLSEPKYALAHTYALIFSRRFNQAQYFLDLLTQRLDQHMLASPNIEGDLHFLKLSLKLFQQDTEALAALNIDELLSSANDGGMRVFSLIIAAYSELQAGKLNNALRIASRSKVVLAELGYILIESYADLIIALCDRYMGRGIEAVNYITTLRDKSNLIEGSLGWVNLNLAMVVVLYEQNRLEEARDLCEKLLPQINHACMTEVISTLYLSLSRLLFIQGNQRKAARVLDQLNRILVFGRYERFSSQYVHESMRQAWISNDARSAKKIVELYELEHKQVSQVDHGNQYREPIERYSLALCYWYIFKGEFDRAASRLKVLSEKLEGLGIVSRALVAKSNLILVDYYRGNKKLAVQRLCNLLDEYSFAHFSRTIFDDAPGLEKVFLHGAKVGSLELPEIFQTAFSDLLSINSAPDPAETSSPVVFTDKEQEVYLLLTSGLSNAEISDRIGTALSTTKWHLKNIYQKLGVSNRSEAIVANRPTGI